MIRIRRTRRTRHIRHIRPTLHIHPIRLTHLTRRARCKLWRRCKQRRENWAGRRLCLSPVNSAVTRLYELHTGSQEI